MNILMTYESWFKRDTTHKAEIGDTVKLIGIEGNHEGEVYDRTDHNKEGKRFNRNNVTYWVDTEAFGKISFSALDIEKK